MGATVRRWDDDVQGMPAKEKSKSRKGKLGQNLLSKSLSQEALALRKAPWPSPARRRGSRASRRQVAQQRRRISRGRRVMRGLEIAEGPKRRLEALRVESRRACRLY